MASETIDEKRTEEDWKLDPTVKLTVDITQLNLRKLDARELSKSTGSDIEVQKEFDTSGMSPTEGTRGLDWKLGRNIKLTVALRQSDLKLLNKPISESTGIGHTQLEERAGSITKKYRDTKAVVKSSACHVCQKLFTSSQYLNQHMRIHTEKKLRACPICSKTLATVRNLGIHKRIHTNERPFKCSKCPRTFRYDNLKVHMRTHTGEKPHACHFCNKAFTLALGLTAHILTHTREKPIICKLCYKAFSSSSNLTHHLRTHTGEKPYRCQLCGKSYRRQSGLIYHLRMHTSENSFKCPLCKNSFQQKFRLDKHLKSHP